MQKYALSTRISDVIDKIVNSVANRVFRRLEVIVSVKIHLNIKSLVFQHWDPNNSVFFSAVRTRKRRLRLLPEHPRHFALCTFQTDVLQYEVGSLTKSTIRKLTLF